MHYVLILQSVFVSYLQQTIKLYLKPTVNGSCILLFWCFSQFSHFGVTSFNQIRL